MNRLRELRKNNKLTLNDLSDKVGIGPAVIGNYERGDRNPKLSVWGNLAEFFGVSVPYIMGIDEMRKGNEVLISLHEYERLMSIERKYNAIKELVSDN